MKQFLTLCIKIYIVYQKNDGEKLLKNGCIVYILD